MVELDVRHTADGHLIVNHDAWYRDKRWVWATPSHERPSGVLELTEALDACRDGADERGRAMAVNVEIKNTPGDLGDNDDPYSLSFVDEVVELLRSRLATREGANDGGEAFVVSSFDPATVDRVRERGGPPTAQLSIDPDWRRVIDSTVQRGHPYIHPWDPIVSEEYLEAAKHAGLVVNTWTVDDPQRIATLARWGVDGIVSNTPALARRALG